MDLFGKIRIQRLRKELTLREKFPSFKIGHETYGEPRIIGAGKLSALEIGNFCSISDDVTVFLDADHRIDWITTFPFNVLWPDECGKFGGHPHTKGNVKIGHDVWLGYGAAIMSGVTIGTGAVIGAKSVVAKDVPPYAIVAGNPARVLRLRFSEQLIERLLASKWWDWPRERILSRMDLLLSNRVGDFLSSVDVQKSEATIPPSLP